MITLALAWKVRLVNHTTLATTVPFADLSTCAYEFFRNGGRWVDWIQMEG